MPTNSDTLEPADLLLIGLPFMNDAWAKYPDDREHMKQAFKTSEGYKQALTALTEREERIKEGAYQKAKQELRYKFRIDADRRYNIFASDAVVVMVGLTENTNPKKGK